MVSEGVLLTAVGMLTVFAFLGLLVALMGASSAFFAAFGDRFPEPLLPSPQQAAASDAGNDEDIAIVLAAVAAHRQRLVAGGA